MVKHPRFLAHVFLLVMTAFLCLEEAHAMKICWQNPTENVDGTPLDNLESIKLYKDGLHLGTYPATGPGQEQCVTFRIAEGVYDFNATAVNANNEESAFSNTVRKTESRLGGPSGGEVLQGPSGGRVITGDDNG